MQPKEQQLEQEKAERQLDETKSRLRMLDARAKQREASGAIAEITGLQALHDRIRDQLKAWKDADQASFDELRDQVRRGTEALSRGTDAAVARFDRLDDANDRWLDAETDQVGAAVQIFYAWLGEEWVEDKKVAESTRSDLRAAWDDVNQKKQALKEAAPQKKDQARQALEDSLERIKRKLQDVATRVKGRAGKPSEQRT
jgi:hypothetical protein